MKKLLFVFLFALYCIYRHRHTNGRLRCYRIRANTLPDLPKSLPSHIKPIFFLETTCKSFQHQKIVITARQACAVESAARQNPNFQIYLLYLSSGRLRLENTESDQFLQELLLLDNVNLYHINIEDYIRDSPVEDLYWSGKWERSRWVFEHTSDILRYLTLWKYGGIYLDLDTMVIKPLDIPFNYAALESPNWLGSAVLSFNSTGSGHKYAEMCLADLKQNFNGRKWANNGPDVITRVIQKLCLNSNLMGLAGKWCHDFRIYPQEMFFPIPWFEAAKLVEEQYLEEVLNRSKNSRVVHFWNNLNAQYRISVNYKGAFVTMARQYCPKVFSRCKRYF